MKRSSLVLILVFFFVSSVAAQTPPPAKKATKAKKSKSFEPPPEPPNGIRVVGEPIVVTGNPPPPAPKYPLEAWKEANFAQESFAVAFPVAPKESSKTGNGGATSSKEYKVITMDGTYSVTVIKLPAKSEESTEALKQRLRGMLKQLESGPYQWLGGKEIEVAGYPGVEFKYKVAQLDEVSWQRFIAVDDRMYRVIAETIVRKPELKEPQIFMDSFKLLPREKFDTESIPPPPPPAPGSNIGGNAVPKIVRVSGGVLQGNALKKVQPPYPPEAIEARAAGAVQIAITISEEGNVIAAEAISGHPLLRNAAVEAAKQWTFKPIELSGVPVKAQGILTFNFTLQ